MTKAPTKAEGKNVPRVQSDQVARLLRQQKALADFGVYALRQTELLPVLVEAAKVCAEGLQVPYCKVCRYRLAEDDLLIEAGFGWNDGVVGHVVSRADVSSPQGRAFVTGLPAICNDLREDDQFKLPAFYRDHGIISTIDVPILGNGKPYGVLEIDNDRQHNYDDHDVTFLTGFANVLGEAVATSNRSTALKAALVQMHALLEQKKTLAEELQHRVRNSLQLIYGMLNKDMPDNQARSTMKAAARRVSTLAQVYDHLLGTEMSRMTDFSGFVRSLCAGLENTQTLPGSMVKLECQTEPLMLDLDVVTALGLIIAEIVTNSYEHAFPGGKGTIRVSVSIGSPNTGRIIIRDDGIGFDPKRQDQRYGLKLISRLVEQVNGTFVTSTTNGATWEISFPIQVPVDLAA
jgi:two-component sensor histidine kinase